MTKITTKISRFYHKRVIPRIQRELCLDELSNNLMTVLDSAVDITKCNPATGKMRDIQLADTELLKLVDLLCEKNGLTYWLDWGTLLGAVRHKGFIPWDDDLDICMPREDFVRAIPIFSDFFSGRPGFDVSGAEYAEENARIWIAYWYSSVLIDVFPIDSFAPEKEKTEDDIALQVIACRKGECASSDASPEQTNEQNERIYYYASNVWNQPKYFKGSAIFPLKKLPFEQYEFNVPNDCDRYLSIEYGNYMAFPRNGILHHHGIVDNERYSTESQRQAITAIKAMQQELLDSEK